jgi:hypothetical protein
MKRISVLAFLMLASCGMMAQKDGGFGIKAGLNYGSTGDLRQSGQTIIDNPEQKIGFHAGFFGKIDLESVYIRPELFFTRLNQQYNGLDAQVDKIDAPVLLGVYVFKPVSIFAGPSFQYILDTDLQDVELARVQEEFTVGLQVGIAVDLGSVGLDLRYERGFKENEAQFTRAGQLGALDTRPEQLTFAISVKF